MKETKSKKEKKEKKKKRKQEDKETPLPAAAAAAAEDDEEEEIHGTTSNEPKSKKRKTTEKRKQTKEKSLTFNDEDFEDAFLPADVLEGATNAPDTDIAWRASLKRTDVKSGPFSKAENNTIREQVAEFARKRGLSTDDYSWLTPTGAGQRSKETLGIWKFVAAALPQRTIKSVAAAGNRMFHPEANKGRWSTEEDEELRQAVASLGNQWMTIGARVGRTREDCRARWRDIRLGDAKAEGHWSVDEEARLVAAVNEYLAAKKTAEAGDKSGTVRLNSSVNGGGGGGSKYDNEDEEEEKMDRRLVLDDINWGVISQRVKTRTHNQCFDKWYEQLSPSMVARGDWGAGDDRRMLRALWRAGPAAEYEVKWGSLVEGRTAAQARRRWRLMTKAVAEHREKEFPEIVDYLVEAYMPRLKEKQGYGGHVIEPVPGGDDDDE